MAGWQGGEVAGQSQHSFGTQPLWAQGFSVMVAGVWQSIQTE